MIILKILYKPVGILVSVLGGIVAGALFKRIWKLAAHEDETPDATDAQRGWGEVLVAATLQGAVTRKLTGFWPGKGAEAEK